MDSVLSLVSINGDGNNASISIFDHTSYPYLMTDISPPECNTGVVYLIASVKRPSFIYIGETQCIITRLKDHNSGNGSSSTTPIKLRPYHLNAYICGFDRNRSLRCHIENQ